VHKPPAVFERVNRGLGALLFERRLKTSRSVGGDKLGLTDGQNPYAPSGWSYLKRGLRGYPVNRNDVFVDFGSGKGRIIYQAARLPFGRVVGIDLSEDLNEIARQNIERNRSRLRCQNVDFITGDMTTTPVPDEMTVAYMFNSVNGELFQRLMANIVASLDRRPRRVRLIYANPEEAATIARTGRFQMIRRSWGSVYHTERWNHIYESLT
jgi:SAM-dependent methyltransferase